MNDIMENKGYSSKVCLCKLTLMSLMIRVPLLSLTLGLWEGTPSYKGNSCLGFRRIKGGYRTLPAFVGCQFPSAPNNLYAKVA